MQTPSVLLFVYGTLMTGRPAHGLLSRWVRAARPASTSGRLFQMPPGYPALVDAPEAGPVHGELLELDPALPWARLDEYEGHDPADPAGSLYLREAREVVTAEGLVRAWCYSMRAGSEARLRAEGARFLPNGRWPPVT